MKCNPNRTASILHSKVKPLVLCLAAAGVAVAQIGYPGQYPGGPYPGSPYPGGGPTGYPSPYPGGSPVPGTGPGIPVPRRGKQPTQSKSKDQPLPNFRGKLKRMDSKSISLELDDYRMMEFRVTGKTKFTKNGETLKSPKFDPGDQISVEALEEPDASMTAVNVYWEKAGAAHSADTDAPPRPSDPSDPGPPTLKREESPQRTQTEVQQTADSNLPPLPADPNDPGPPTLKHEKAPKRTETSEKEEAKEETPAPARTPKATPSPAPRETASAVPLPKVDLPPVELPKAERPEDQAPATQRREDALIQKAAEAALDFTETLPNYVVQEMMARSQSTSQPANWQPLDVLTMEVVYDKGKENYRNLAINGKPTTKSMSELGGAWSTGEFGTMLIDLFSPATDADFRPKGASRIAGIDAKLYDFEVKRENSHWDLHFGPQTYSPAYGGSVWIDPATARVLRIEMQARDLPKEFPADHVESATDYQYVRLGGTKQFLLPVHSETLSCQRGTPNCSQNKIDFRNYHKYEGESTVEFSPVK